MLETENDINELNNIFQRIGYGNACKIICKNWMKQKRSAIEEQEKMQHVINMLKAQTQANCNHEFIHSFFINDPVTCKKCGASIRLDD